MGTGYLQPHMDYGPLSSGPDSTFEPIGIEADAVLYTRDQHLEATRRLLDDDPHAAFMVAALVSTVQSANETRPAFVKRIVRSWLEEMARPVTV